MSAQQGDGGGEQARRASRTSQSVAWTGTGDPEFPYRASVEGETWTIRVDDFPVTESRYTLFVDGVAREPVVDWPTRWTRQRAR